MKYVRILLSGVGIITKLLDLFYNKVEQFRRNREKRKMVKLKDATRKNIINNDVDRINDNLKF